MKCGEVGRCERSNIRRHVHAHDLEAAGGDTIHEDKNLHGRWSLRGVKVEGDVDQRHSVLQPCGPERLLVPASVG